MRNIDKKINYDTQLYTVSQIISFIDEGKIILNSNIGGRLWSVEKKRQYIENFLIALPHCPIILDGSLKNDRTGRYDFWIVVDGYNRLCALNEFFKGKLYVEEQRFYNDLSSSEQSLIEEKELTFYILSPDTSINLRYEFFERMNPISNRQKVRNIINQGIPYDLITELKQHFLQFFDIHKYKLNISELILSYIAFALFEYDNKQTLSLFLDESMNEIKKLDKNRIEDIKQSFLQVLDNIKSKNLTDSFYDYDKTYDYNEKPQKLNFLKNLFLHYSLNINNLDGLQNDLSIFKLDKEEENRLLKLVQKL